MGKIPKQFKQPVRKQQPKVEDRYDFWASCEKMGRILDEDGFKFGADLV